MFLVCGGCVVAFVYLFICLVTGLRLSEALTNLLCYSILLIKSSGLFIYKIDCFPCKDIGVYYRIIEFKERLEETSKIISSNYQPSTTTVTLKAFVY